jgi:hypothetical protein
MTANEDHAAQSSRAADPDRPADDLEDWLSDLRTDEEPGSDYPTRPAAEQPSAGGRHRAPDQ